MIFVFVFIFEFLFSFSLEINFFSTTCLVVFVDVFLFVYKLGASKNIVIVSAVDLHVIITNVDAMIVETFTTIKILIHHHRHHRH